MNDLEKYFYSPNKGRKPINKFPHYFPIYEKYLSRFRGLGIHLLEIGVGQGGSLQMWKDYFGASATIYGADTSNNFGAKEEQIEVLTPYDQGNRESLRGLVHNLNGLDILIDDGSHVCQHQINTFEELFPFISEDGVYICEDVQTSYAEKCGGGYRNPNSFIEYVKRLVDTMHAIHTGVETRTILADSIASITFYPLCIVIEKGINQVTSARLTGEGADRTEY